MSGTTPDQLRCEHSHWHAGGYCSNCCIDAKVVKEFAVLRSQKALIAAREQVRAKENARKQARIEALEAELEELGDIYNALLVKHHGNGQELAELKGNTIAKLDTEASQLAARNSRLEQQLAALREAALAEVARQRHQYAILRQELPPTTAALAALLQGEKG